MDTGCQSNNSISKRVGCNLFRVLNWKSQDKSHSILFICILSFLYQAKNYYTTFKADSFPTRFSIPLFLLLIFIYLGRWVHRIITHHNSKQKQSHMCFKDEIESKQDQHDSIYCFSVYHHQRWLFPTGWNDLTHDRPAWSDIYLEETPSIDEFQLPPVLSQDKRIVEWEWLDPHWFVSTANIDRHDSFGWQYGDSQWRHWTKQPYGFGIFTRRRLWIRRAKRIERTACTESIFSEDLFSDWESTSSLSDKSTL